MPALPAQPDLIGSKNQVFADALRRVADFFDTHPEFPTPILPELRIVPYGPEQFRQLARNLGGYRAKATSQLLKSVSRDFGEGLTLTVVMLRGADERCEQVQVGEREVEITVEVCHICGADVIDTGDETYCPVDRAHLRYRPARKTVKVVEPIMEWCCDEVLS